MNFKPKTEKAWNALLSAYKNLSEKQKRAISRHIAKTQPQLFKHWTKNANLPGGYDQKKVYERDLNYGYGSRLDEALQTNTKIATAVFFEFLFNNKIAQSILIDIPETAHGEEYEHSVDEKAAESDSEFADFASAYLKCYPPDPKPLNKAAEAAEIQMNRLVTKLNEHADKLDKWAASLRLAETLPCDDVTETINAANQDAKHLEDLMRKYGKICGCDSTVFSTPADVAEHVKKLCEALCTQGKNEKLAIFLCSLAAALRALKVVHRSSLEQGRLLVLRDDAADEVKNSIDSSKPKWNQPEGESGRAWLRWAFELRDKALNDTQERLKNDGYEKLCELIGIGDVKWISNEIEDDHITVETPKQAEEKSETAASPIKTKIPHISGKKDVAAIAEKETVTSNKETENTVENTPPQEQIGSIMPTESSQDIFREPSLNVDDVKKIPSNKKTKKEDEESFSDIKREPKSINEPDKASYWENKDVLEIANTVVNEVEKPNIEAVAALAAKLAKKGEYSLAYHLSSSMELLNDYKTSHVIPAWIYGAAACGSSIHSTDQASINMIQSFFQNDDDRYFNELKDDDKEAVCLLLAAGALLPALFMPITGAAGILQTKYLRDMPSFHRLVIGVKDYGSMGVGLPRAALYATITADELKRKQNNIQAKAKEWLVERAPKFEIVSRPGHATWRAWISKDEPVGMMLRPVIEGKKNDIRELKKLIEKYSDESVVKDEARKLYRDKLEHRGELLRPALDKILRHTAEAIKIADDWISIVERQPDTPLRYDQNMLNQLRACFRKEEKTAQQELKLKSENSSPSAVRGGAKLCEYVVDAIGRILNEEGMEQSTKCVRNAGQILNDDLYRITSLFLDENGSPRLQNYCRPITASEAKKTLAREVVKCIGNAVAKGIPSFPEAAKIRADAGDHENTEEILKLLESSETAENLKKLEQERSQSIARHRETVQRPLKLAQRDLTDALNKGLFLSQEHEIWAVRLASAEHDLKSPGFLRFADIYAICNQLVAKLYKQKSIEISRIRKEIDLMNPPSELRVRLEDVLANEDVQTATDYLDRIRNKQDLPDTDKADASPFMQYFGKEKESSCELLERELTNSTVRDVITRVRKRKPVTGLQLDDLQNTHAIESEKFLDNWFEVKTARRLGKDLGISIFNFFGMLPKKFVKDSDSKKSSFRGDVWNLQIKPLESRDVCPSPSFGSEARGDYRVIAYWDRPAAEDIFQHARELGSSRPVIVLNFGRMSMAERRRLAAEADRTNVIVIDDILAVFIAAQRKGRLLALFQCALPFANIAPYTKGASLLPPEMFYGRHREIRQLMSAGTDSSCLLYGGRQIGKTVLLNRVKDLFNAENPEANVAVYIDLKAKEIGTFRPMDEVWYVIAEKLDQKEVITEKINRQTNHEWLFARIEKWLAEDDKRRILVLLDESDGFLSADAKGDNSKASFSACTVLKELMERTNRRFKIVFAGLHNVQKSTKVSNNPLAHYGEPICIGAMTDAGESREAEALITEPLAAAGYFFESADLPARVLAQTNYYPNLIQIYCDELLDYMKQRRRALFPPDKTPPYIINAKILEDVYEQHELREELRLRFKWTLELDRRFELIANILAKSDIDWTRGLDVAEIQQQAQSYWKIGFCAKDGTPLTYETFKNLLEEMVGLGILRRAEPPDRYTLRNPNVLNLLGSGGSIEKLLENAEKWEPVDEYDPTKFRGQISDKNKSIKSPLNAAQESKFKSGANQVFLVCGCPAGQINHVEESIQYRFGRDSFVRVLEGHKTLSDFEEELDHLKKRKSGGTTLIVVPDTVRWDRSWMKKAIPRVRSFATEKGAVGVVFVAGSIHLWSIVQSDIPWLKSEGVNFMTVEPWDESTVNQWSQEIGHNAVNGDIRSALSGITGNWPVFLEDALKAIRDGADTIDAIKDSIYNPDRKCELYNKLGLEIEATLAPLRFLCENGDGWSAEEIAGLIVIDGESRLSLDHVENVLTWAELTGLTRRGPQGWMLNGGVRQVLALG